MEIFKIVSFAVVAVFVITVLKSLKKDDFALIVTILAAVVMFVFLLLKVEDIINILMSVITKAGINEEYLALLLKVTGVSYIVELATNICKDAGSSSLASKVEMLGKVSIVVLTIPILTSVLNVVLEIV